MSNLPIILAEAAGSSAKFDNIAFIVCLVLGIVCLALAVLFFFVFNIPQVYLIKSGKGAKKTIKKMEEINAETGRLRKISEDYMVSPIPTGTTAETGEQNRDPNINIPFKPAAAPAEGAQDGEGSNQTTVLGQSGSTLLDNNATTVLNATAEYMQETSNAYVYNRETNGRFDVTFSLVYTHSDEII